MRERERENMEMRNREFINLEGGFDEQTAWERGRRDTVRVVLQIDAGRREESSEENSKSHAGGSGASSALVTNGQAGQSGSIQHYCKVSQQLFRATRNVSQFGAT